MQVNKYNTHWRPYWIHCNICKLEFDLFAKFETLADDMETIRGERHKDVIIKTFEVIIFNQMLPVWEKRMFNCLGQTGILLTFFT